MLVCIDTVRLKLDIPFGFGFLPRGRFRPQRSAPITQLRAFDACRTGSLVDGVTHIVASNSTPSDTVFSFPEMAIFYSSPTEKWPTQTALTT